MEIKNKIIFFLAGLLMSASVFTAMLPVTVQAAGPIDQGLSGISGSFNTGGGIAKSKNVNELLVNVIKILLGVAFAVALLFVIVGGFMYMTSAGNEDQAKKGRTTLINAVIGIVLIVLAYAIISVVVNFVSTDAPSGGGSSGSQGVPCSKSGPMPLNCY